MELTIPRTVNGVIADTVEGWVTPILAALNIDGGTFTHIIYVLPQSVLFSGAAGYAYLDWCKYSSVLLCIMACTNCDRL